MEQWVYDHASENLKLYMDYRNWVGDEGQLCDGKGNALLRNKDDRWSWIQDWDVNEQGYCVFEGTQELILNMDGKPIKYKREKGIRDDNTVDVWIPINMEYTEIKYIPTEIPYQEYKKLYKGKYWYKDYDYRTKTVIVYLPESVWEESGYGKN